MLAAMPCSSTANDNMALVCLLLNKACLITCIGGLLVKANHADAEAGMVDMQLAHVSEMLSLYASA